MMQNFITAFLSFVISFGLVLLCAWVILKAVLGVPYAEWEQTTKAIWFMGSWILTGIGQLSVKLSEK